MSDCGVRTYIPLVVLVLFVMLCMARFEIYARPTGSRLGDCMLDGWRSFSRVSYHVPFRPPFNHPLHPLTFSLSLASSATLSNHSSTLSMTAGQIDSTIPFSTPLLKVGQLTSSSA